MNKFYALIVGAIVGLTPLCLAAEKKVSVAKSAKTATYHPHHFHRRHHLTQAERVARAQKSIATKRARLAELDATKQPLNYKAVSESLQRAESRLRNMQGKTPYRHHTYARGGMKTATKAQEKEAEAGKESWLQKIANAL